MADVILLFKIVRDINDINQFRNENPLASFCRDLLFRLGSFIQLLAYRIEILNDLNLSEHLDGVVLR